MTTIKFDKVPTGVDELNVDNIQQESVKEAWQAYEAKPEYKKFNKHDMIESMLGESEQDATQ